MHPVIKGLSSKTLKKSWKRRNQFIKNLKNPKFRAKAKLKDFQSPLDETGASQWTKGRIDISGDTFAKTMKWFKG